MKNRILSYLEFIKESQDSNFPEEITLQKLSNLINTEDKIWILTGGVPGAGKSYIVKEKLNISVIDMDEYVEKLSGGNGKYNSLLGGKARVLARADVDKNFRNGKSFLKQGVSANLIAVKNQCEQAKSFNYICVFLFVDVSLEKAKKNNEKRVKSGERESLVKEYVLERKWKESNEVFKMLQKTPNLFHYIVHYKN